MRKARHIIVIFCLILLVNSVSGFTNCPSEESYLETLIVMINNYFDDPTNVRLTHIIDLVQFYDTHDLSISDCSEKGGHSGKEVSKILSLYAGLNLPSGETCYDNIKNQDEEGIDCGGICGVACPSCSDGKQNQDEEGIDCGGPCSKVCQEACPITSDCTCIASSDGCCDPDCENGWDPDCHEGLSFQKTEEIEVCDDKESSYHFGTSGGLYEKTWNLSKSMQIKKVTFRIQDTSTVCESDRVRISFRYESTTPICPKTSPNPIGWIEAGWFEVPFSSDWSNNICIKGPEGVEITVFPDQNKRVKEIKMDFEDKGSKSILEFDCISYEKVEDKDADLLDVSRDCDDQNSARIYNCA